nr:MAG TPA: hypothetical protein [Caudoviricetes sp.]
MLTFICKDCQHIFDVFLYFAKFLCYIRCKEVIII